MGVPRAHPYSHAQIPRVPLPRFYLVCTSVSKGLPHQYCNFIFSVRKKFPQQLCLSGPFSGNRKATKRLKQQKYAHHTFIYKKKHVYTNYMQVQYNNV